LIGDKLSKSNPWYQRHLWQIAPLRDLLWIFLGIFLLWAGYQLRTIFIPVLIAFALAYLFDPLISWAERNCKAPRPVTISILLTILTFGGAFLLTWLGPEFIKQFDELLHGFINYLHAFAIEYDIDPLKNLQTEIEKWIQHMEKNPVGFIVENTEVLLTGTTQAVSVITSIIGTTVYMGAMILLIPLYFFFFAWHFGLIMEKIRELIPVKEKERTLAIAKEMDEAVAAFFRGRLVISSIVAVLFSVGWSPLLADIPYWLVLGISAGILNFIPYAAGLAWLAAIFSKSLDIGFGNDFDLWSIIIWPSLVYGMVQFIDGGLLTPWIQGRSLNLSTVTIIIVVLIGGALGGIYGLLLCIPIAACAKILFTELVLPHLHQWAEKY
jgi:predicted PurR-regulated permease PerM